MNNDWKEKGYIDEPVDGSVDLKKEIRRLCEEKEIGRASCRERVSEIV